MSKGYFGEEAEAPKQQEVKKRNKADAVGVAIGMTVGLALVFSLEALLVWVILAYLLKANLAFTQVLGGVLLFEYVLGRSRLKQ